MENNDRFGANAQNPGQRSSWGQSAATPGQRPMNAGGAAPAGQRPMAPQGGLQGQSRAPSAHQNLSQEVEQLSREREQIALDRARAQNEQERASEDWEKLSEELRERFGTDDLDAIAQTLDETEQRNQQKVAEYRQAIAVAREETQDALRRQEEARRL